MVLLLEHRADVHHADYIGTPLLRAAQASGDTGLEVATVLLEAGAKVDHRDDNKGSTPLMFAAQFSNLEVARALIAAGAQVDLRNNNGETPLMWAVKNSYVDVVKLLLEQGADPELTDNDGDGLESYYLKRAARPEEVRAALQSAKAGRV